MSQANDHRMGPTRFKKVRQHRNAEYHALSTKQRKSPLSCRRVAPVQLAVLASLPSTVLLRQPERCLDRPPCALCTNALTRIIGKSFASYDRLAFDLGCPVVSGCRILFAMLSLKTGIWLFLWVPETHRRNLTLVPLRVGSGKK